MLSVFCLGAEHHLTWEAGMGTAPSVGGGRQWESHFSEGIESS